MCDFYYAPASPPCRSVLMLAKALDVELNKKAINTMNKEHLTPEFLKINPQHTIPTLVDDGFSIWESRAILVYLVEKYGKGDSLYPEDPQERAVVNQRLYFDMGTMFQRFYEYYIPQMMMKQPADPEKFKKMEEAVEFFDGFLSATVFAAGDKFTIADYALFSTMSTYEVLGYDFSRFKNISRWYEECKTSLPGVKENEDGVIAMKGFIEKFKEHKH